MDKSQESENGEEDNLQVTTIELGLYFIKHVYLIFLSYIHTIARIHILHELLSFYHHELWNDDSKCFTLRLIFTYDMILICNICSYFIFFNFNIRLII